jgi:hypothetical protein
VLVGSELHGGSPCVWCVVSELSSILEARWGDTKLTSSQPFLAQWNPLGYSVLDLPETRSIGRHKQPRTATPWVVLGERSKAAPVRGLVLSPLCHTQQGTGSHQTTRLQGCGKGGRDEPGASAKFSLHGVHLRLSTFFVIYYWAFISQ